MFWALLLCWSVPAGDQCKTIRMPDSEYCYEYEDKMRMLAVRYNKKVDVLCINNEEYL